MKILALAAGLYLVCACLSQSAFGDFIDTVLISNPGNAGKEVGFTTYADGSVRDDRWYKAGVFGSVSYSYRIGATEVTNDQYVTFLNAIAATDTHSLYDPLMTTDIRGGIQRLGVSGSYTYVSKANMGNKPVNYVSYWDTNRFANWMHNGMPTGPQNLSTTEDGAYFLNGVTNPGRTANYEERNVPRKADAKWFLPTDDEWFKAAYHKNDGVTGNYFDYPTATDIVPTRALADAVGNVSNPGSNVVNYNSYADWNGMNGNVTTVGSTGSPSAYGTFDQAGNLDEWTSTLLYCLPTACGGCPAGPSPDPTDPEKFGISAVLRGGTWQAPNDFHIVGINNGNRDIGGMGGGSADTIGFRLAAITTIVIDPDPEPEPDPEPSGDFDEDGDVDGADFLTWQRNVVSDTAASVEDFDEDGDVDGADFLTWQRNVGPSLAEGDANDDGVVNGDDLDVWTSQFGSASPMVAQSGIAVPESASLALAIAGFCGACTVQMRRRS